MTRGVWFMHSCFVLLYAGEASLSGRYRPPLAQRSVRKILDTSTLDRTLLMVPICESTTRAERRSNTMQHTTSMVAKVKIQDNRGEGNKAKITDYSPPDQRYPSSTSNQVSIANNNAGPNCTTARHSHALLLAAGKPATYTPKLSNCFLSSRIASIFCFASISIL